MTESNRIEYKRELTDSIEKEVVAFLNAGEDRLKNNIQPSIMGLFEIIHETREGKDVLCLRIAGGLEKPCFLKKYGMTEKGCFLRVGSASEPMPKEMIESLYGKRVRNTIGRMDSPRRSLTFAQLKIYTKSAACISTNASWKTSNC